MKIAITGGAGYIGCRLSELLLNDGHIVDCIDILKYGIEPILNIVDKENFNLHVVDITTKEVDPILKQADAVIHLAGIVGYPACYKQPELSHSVNVEGTQRVVDASVDKMFVFASSGSVYGELNTVCNETIIPNPMSLYSEHKIIGEDMLKGTDAVILRPATAFGVSNRLRNDLLINDFTRRAIEYGELELFQGHFKRTFISINDLALSFKMAITKNDVMRGDVWNVGDTDLNCTKFEAAKLIQKYVDYEIIDADEKMKDLDVRNYFVDYSKIANIGFKASESMETGIKNLVKVYSALKHEL